MSKIPKRKFKHPIIQYINRRLDKNKNFMGIFCGETGSGKSYAALRLAEILDPNFKDNVQTRVVFRVKDFMKLLNEGNLPPRSVIVFDEAGVGIPAKEWYSVSNKLFNYVLQTFRSRRYVTIFTTPDFSYVDKSSRKLFHAYGEPLKINQREQKVTMVFNIIQNNAKLGKIYYKRLTGIVNGNKTLFNTLTFNKPSDQVCRAYEYMKEEFNNKLFKSVEKGLEKFEEDKRELQKGRIRLTARQEEIYGLFKQGLNGVQIANKLGISTSVVSSQKERIRTKGYDT